jgi:hypothetical protein
MDRLRPALLIAALVVDVTELAVNITIDSWQPGFWYFVFPELPLRLRYDTSDRRLELLGQAVSEIWQRSRIWISVLWSERGRISVAHSGKKGRKQNRLPWWAAVGLTRWEISWGLFRNLKIWKFSPEQPRDILSFRNCLCGYDMIQVAVGSGFWARPYRKFGNVREFGFLYCDLNGAGFLSPIPGKKGENKIACRDEAPAQSFS